MQKFRVFYYYECPFCKLAHEALMEILPGYPGMEVEWRPVESGLCIQAFYIAEEQGTDMDVFHRVMYQGLAVDRRNSEKSEVLAEILKGIVDSGRFLTALRSGKYAHKVDENNDLAYKENGVWYVPAFRVPGESLKGLPKLDARCCIGVSRKQIKKFLDKLAIH